MNVNGMAIAFDLTLPLPPLSTVLRSVEASYVVGVLTFTRGSVSDAAAIAGRNRTEFYKLLKRHGIVPAHYRRQAEA